MCGIAGYIGEQPAGALLLNAIRQLEYRGYDSVGIATVHEKMLHVRKGVGKVSDVNAALRFSDMLGTIGISHTRWSTHGKPCQENAHPFLDEKKEFALVHNGIIENYLELKESLRKEGVSFSSETDSEVIVHLIAKHYRTKGSGQGNLKEAVLQTLQQLQGAYAFCVLHQASQEIIAVRNGSPLVIGLGERENFLASDVSALIQHTKRVIYVNDFELARVTNDAVELFSFHGEKRPLQVKEIKWDLEQAQKQGYKHFMLKEIFEQPEVIAESLRTPPSAFAPFVPLSFASEPSTFATQSARRYKHITIVACGTASHAGLLGKYLIERISGIPVMNEIASEFRYRNPLLENNSLAIAISQSGETADTLAAVRLAKEKGARTLGIINVVDSTITREVHDVLYTKAGPEIGVASTKAFTAQLVTLYQLAFALAGKQLPQSAELIDIMKKTLAFNEYIKQLAQKYYRYQNFLYIGRNTNFPLALEGALKLKEISYIHAEAYPAGELKHGPIALVSEEMPTIAICPQDAVYQKTLSNIEEIKARNGKVIALATEGDEILKKLCDDMIFVPKVEEIFYPLLLAIPLQLFAYHIADIKECDVDQPRNLAKAVTVE